jgi:hypothetical protein
MKSPGIERVEWLDSTFLGTGWQDVDENVMNKGREIIVTVGFVAGEDDDSLVMALSWNSAEEAKDWGSVFVIPKQAVVSRRKMRLNGKTG